MWKLHSLLKGMHDMQIIEMSKRFNAPVRQVFEDLCDHEKFGHLTSASIVRIKDAGDAGNPNGLGSVRRIKVPGVPAIEETVIRFEPNRRMDYTITRGGPITNHRGSLRFRSEGDATVVDYTISFEPKLPIPLLGTLLEGIIRFPINRGLDKLARSYNKQRTSAATQEN
ncbi:MAG: MxaD family protein [unclassified Hahellaceae]|nr:MxaD family protein [Hahellaceae bacterium]|tara:strand:- start:19585 stop:20091 length:507 start_codon:yes stop_codon:yes gene_type:complete